jgi:hypothetical protein
MSEATAAVMPPKIKKVVTFIFLADPQGNLAHDSTTNNPIPMGTGFFVFVKNEAGGPGGYSYLVTAKHVLKDSQGRDLPRIFIRLDKLQGDSEFVSLDLLQSGRRIVYSHPTDSTVDIAVIPILPNESVYDFKAIPEDMITTKESFAGLQIAEGTDVFFLGLFVPYYGQHKNIPVFRFGRVAMFPEQSIRWQDSTSAAPQNAQIYLLEAQSYGGSSGSPVFFYLGSDRIPGRLVLGPPEIRLAGIIRGTFIDTHAVGIVQIPNVPVATYSQNVGIAAVTPSYLLQQILFSAELAKLRADNPILLNK